MGFGAQGLFNYAHVKEQNKIMVDEKDLLLILKPSWGERITTTKTTTTASSLYLLRHYFFQHSIKVFQKLKF